MLRLPYGVLEKNYPLKKAIPRDTLFRELGWDDLINNAAFENTCAIRMSVALIRSGVTIPAGRIPIKAGPHRGKRVEPGQAKLADILATNALLGKPEKFSTSEAENGIGSRSGIVSFYNLLPGVYDHGHIDIVSSSSGGFKICGMDCYWKSKQVWFWPLR